MIQTTSGLKATYKALLLS